MARGVTFCAEAPPAKLARSVPLFAAGVQPHCPPLHIARNRTPFSLAVLHRCCGGVRSYYVQPQRDRAALCSVSQSGGGGAQGALRGRGGGLGAPLTGTRRQSCAPWLLWPPNAPPAAWSVACWRASSSRRRAQRARGFRVTRTHLAPRPPRWSHRTATAGESEETSPARNVTLVLAETSVIGESAQRVTLVFALALA